MDKRNWTTQRHWDGSDSVATSESNPLPVNSTELNDRIGEVSSTPTENTVQWRLDEITIAAEAAIRSRREKIIHELPEDGEMVRFHKAGEFLYKGLGDEDALTSDPVWDVARYEYTDDKRFRLIRIEFIFGTDWDSVESGNASPDGPTFEELLADDTQIYLRYKFAENSGTVATEEIGGYNGTYVNNPTLNQPSLTGTNSSVLFTKASGQYINLYSELTPDVFAGKTGMSFRAPFKLTSLPADGDPMTLAFFTTHNNALAAIQIANDAGVYKAKLFARSVYNEPSQFTESVLTGLAINETNYLVTNIDLTNDKLQIIFNGQLLADTSVTFTSTTFQTGTGVSRKHDIAAQDDNNDNIRTNHLDGYIENFVFSETIINTAQALDEWNSIQEYGS